MTSKTLIGPDVDNDPAAIKRYLDWIKPRKCDLIGMIVDMTTWEKAVQVSWIVDNLQNVQGYNLVTKNADGSRTINAIIHWTVALILHPSGATLEDAAAGKYIAPWKQLAQNILAVSPKDDSPIYIRAGSEHNSTPSWGYSWASRGKEATYAAAYALHAKTFKDVSKRFKMVWCQTVSELDPTPAYPGDAAVDVIDLDFYLRKQYADGKTPEQYWKYYKTSGGASIDWLLKFAKLHNKQIGFSEWGVGCPEADRKAWQDTSAAAWQLQGELLRDNDVAYFLMWDRAADASAVCVLSDGKSSIAGNAFKTMIDTAKGGTATPTPTPAPTPTPTPTPQPGPSKMQWNPNNAIGPITIGSDGKLTASNYARVGATPAILPDGSFKYAIKAEGSTFSIGFWTNNHVLGIQPYHVGGSTHSIGIYSDGNIVYNGKAIKNLGPIASGSIVGVEVNAKSKVAIFTVNGQSYSVSIAEFPAWTQLSPAVGVEAGSATFGFIDVAVPTPTPSPTPTPTPTPQPTTQKVSVTFENGEVWNGTLTKV